MFKTNKTLLVLAFPFCVLFAFRCELLCILHYVANLCYNTISDSFYFTFYFYYNTYFILIQTLNTFIYMLHVHAYII